MSVSSSIFQQIKAGKELTHITSTSTASELWFQDSMLSTLKLPNMLPPGARNITSTLAVKVIDFLIENQDEPAVQSNIVSIMLNLAVRTMVDPIDKTKLLFSRFKGKKPWSDDDGQSFDFDSFLSKLEGTTSHSEEETNLDKILKNQAGKTIELFNFERSDSRSNVLLPSLIGFYCLLIIRMATKRQENYLLHLGKKDGMDTPMVPFLTNFNKLYKTHSVSKFPIFKGPMIQAIKTVMDNAPPEFQWVALTATNIIDQVKNGSPNFDLTSKDAAGVLRAAGMITVYEHSLPAWSLTSRVSSLLGYQPHQFVGMLYYEGYTSMTVLRLFQFIYHYILKDEDKVEFIRLVPAAKVDNTFQYSIYWPCCRIINSDWLTAIGRKHNANYINLVGKINDRSVSDTKLMIFGSGYVPPSGTWTEQDAEIHAEILLNNIKKSMGSGEKSTELTCSAEERARIETSVSRRTRLAAAQDVAFEPKPEEPKTSNQIDFDELFSS